MPQVTYNPVLTELTLGYSNAEMIYSALFPIVTVEHPTGQIPKFGIDSFRLRDTKRGMYQNSNETLNEVEDTVSFICQERDLVTKVDVQEFANYSWLDLQQRRAQIAKDGVELSIERDASVKAFTAGNYANSNKTVISSGSCWNESSGDPIENVNAAMDGLENVIGKRPNRVFFGQQAWQDWKNSDVVKAAIASTSTKIVTMNLTKELLEIDNVFIGRAKYAAEGSSTTTSVWGDSVLFAFVPDGAPNILEPAYGYALRYKGHPYVDEPTSDQKIPKIRYTDYIIPTVTSYLAGYLISNTHN